jgi:UDP-N-acetylglucosamine:LPS N-acetylglucosamine transferase
MHSGDQNRAAIEMKKHIMLLLGEGGHTKEMLRLAELLGDEYTYSYTMVQDDEVSAAKITMPGRIYRVIRPRDKAHNAALDTLKTLLCALQAFAILLRARPVAVISTGPSVAVPVFAAAKLLSCRVIFIETGSRLHALSTTGRIVYKYGLADVFMVQWQELLAGAPKAIYAGRLW